MLGAPVPAAAVIRAEIDIDIDERFIGEDYAVPSDEGVAAIKELAVSDGVFLGPVHTGDTGNLFEIPEVLGDVVG